MVIGLSKANIIRFASLQLYCFGTDIYALNDEVLMDVSSSLRSKRNENDSSKVNMNRTTAMNNVQSLFQDAALSTSNQQQQQQPQSNQRNLFFIDSLFDRNPNCPPPNFDAIQDFDINLYLGRWYAHKQIPVSYQRLDQFYCVTTEYTKDTNFCPFCNYANRIDILNEARQDSVNGTKLGGARRFFRGIIRRPRRDPAKITVGTFAPFLFRANYWVVATGSYEDIFLDGKRTVGMTTMYEWAIITGGSPELEGMNGKCKPNPGIFNFLGMWMFLRDSDPLPGVIEAIDTYASNVLGLDTSAWLPVEHQGCIYD
jgi:lipocalin